MTGTDRLRSRFGQKASALLMIACGISAITLTSSAYAQATTARSPIARFMQNVAAGGHIVNSDEQCLDADSNHWGQNGDSVQLWACNSNDEQIWPQE